jgi:predicted NAD/FAD-dependent oxidoreductase
MNAEHVIFGAGAIGLATAAVLRDRSESVRMVNRSGSGGARTDVRS